VALALALVIAATATTFGLWIVVQFVQRGNYVGAMVAPFWLVLPGCAPLVVLIVRRRRAMRKAQSNVTRFSAELRNRKRHPRERF
jgi:hypothetical protein